MTRIVVDLTQPFFNGMLYNWYIPGVPRPEIVTIEEADKSRGKLGFQKIITSTHIGTHVDAQKHAVKGGMSIDEYPMKRLYGPAVCWDVTGVGRLGEITPVILERCSPKIRDGDVVLLYCGHGKFFESNYHLYYEQPYLTVESARWLIERKVITVGIDGHTVDRPYALRSMMFVPGSSEKQHYFSPAGPGQPSVHSLLLGANILIVEHMANLDKVAGKRFTLCVAPLKLKGGDGSPARCFAVLER